ncbi:MAG: rod shape-determining protein MreC [Bacteroidales bacterium]|jgi:rod shape-determining protein MreC|nr:rod shape-determining protein MreC [Bacteroidales bacterium]
MRGLFRFISKFYYVFLFLILEIAAVFFIINNSYYQGSKIGNYCNSVASKIFQKQDNITYYFGLSVENKRLAKENAALRSQLLTSFVPVNNDSIVVNDTDYVQQYSYVEAKIIERTLGKRNNYFVINKGEKNGIEQDMGVICADGLVGFVVKTTDNFSLVMPVLHQDSRHSVRNKRTNVTGTLIWEGGSYTEGRIIDFPSSIPLKRGDTIITSGFSSNIPEGIAVGYVDKVYLDKGTGFYEVNIRFSADYNNLKYVYVIKNFFQSEERKLMSNIEKDKERN